MTTVPLPASIQYGKIVGQLVQTSLDGNDVDETPDGKAVAGSATLTPLDGQGELRDGVFVFFRAFVVPLDSEGVISAKNGQPGVWLPVGRWRVAFTLPGLSMPPFDIEVTTAHTALAPLNVMTLAPSLPAFAPTILSPYLRGKSAYEIAVDGGFVGTEAEWLESFGQGSRYLVENGGTYPVRPFPADEPVTFVGEVDPSAVMLVGDTWIDTNPGGPPLDFTPKPHKASHATGGSDPLTPADIGAATATQGAKADSAVQPADIAAVIVDAATLPATLSALPTYAGGPIRRVVVKPGNYTLTATLTIPSGVHLVAHGCTFTSAIPSDTGRMVTISGVTDVTVEGGIWDGAKAAYAPTTEQRHNIYCHNSSRVAIRFLTSRNAKGDGIYVGTDTTPSTDVTITEVLCDGSHRNGLGISGLRRGRISNSTFANSTGTHPMAGLDIECNTATGIVDDITFTACAFTGNAQYGAMVSQPNVATARQGGITFTACGFTDNGAVGGLAGYRCGLRLHQAQNVRLIGGQIRGSADEGVRVTAASSDISLIGVEVSNNSSHGFWAPVSVSRLTLSGCRFVSNGQAAAATYDGICLEVATGAEIIGTVSTGSSQRYGLRATSTSVTGLSIVGGALDGNGTGSVSLSDDGATRFRSDPGGVTTRGALDVTRAAAGDVGISAKLAGDAQSRLLIRADGDIRFGDGTTAGDTRLYRSAADTLRTNDTFIADVALQTAGPVLSTGTTGTGYIELREQTSDPAGTTDRGRIFVKDNGAGKSQVCVKFATGAVVVIATEP